MSGAAGTSMRAGASPNGQYLLRFRYLQRLPDGTLETPMALFQRVARNLADAERRFDPALNDARIAAYADTFLEVMIDGAFLPNAPTLLGAGTALQQLCACFVLPVGDSVDAIFEALRMAACVHSKGGGTGFSFSAVRGRGAAIRSGGQAGGVVPFLRLFDAETELIKHGGTGWGANMAVLRCDHPDIREFVTAKSRHELHNFNLSVGVTDEFMHLVRVNGQLPLVDPHAGPTGATIAAGELMHLIAQEAWTTGDPGLLFLDRINAGNPTPRLGQLEATNPCGEAPLLPFEACCLGGINVARFWNAAAHAVEWSALRATARIAVRMMDNVIEASAFPVPQIAEATRRTRKLGIGVMGFADLLIQMGVPYDSAAAEQAADRLMAEIADATHEASRQLAEERGSFPAFADSMWAGGAGALRNATTTSNAPNSTISAIAGCSAGIEPLFAVGYTKQLANGDRLTEINPQFEAIARSRGFATDALFAAVCREGSVQAIGGIPDDVRRLFVTAHDIAPEWHVRIQAAFQRHTDLGISKTINLPHTATPDDVAAAYLRAHDAGCKGITCFRDGCLDRPFLVRGIVASGRADCPDCTGGEA